MNIIGVDIGTQGTKAALFHEDGRILAEAFEPSRLITDSGGGVEQDPGEIYSSVITTVRTVMEKSGADPSSVASIGIDGQMAGILGIDQEWKAITPYDSWLDTRCEKYILMMKERAGDEIARTTGCPVTYAHGPKILWWKNERPSTYAGVEKFIMPSTYVAGRMAGLKSGKAWIDYTHIHFSGFCSVEKKEWSDELLREFGVDRQKMPEVVEPWKIAGKLSREAAEACRLIPGIPVAAGCGDQAATSLGAGITAPGMAFDVAGTASVFSCCVDRYEPDMKNMTLIFPRAVIDGLWIPLAYINGGGLCLKWFRDNLADKSASYDVLDGEAEKIPPGSGGLIFIPHFSGRVCPSMPGMRGSWLGLNFGHTRGHLFRSIRESIAYEYRIYLDILRDLTGIRDFKSLSILGGGARSGLFNSIKSDVLGIPCTTMVNSETATLGSAIVAGYAAGIYRDMAETAGSLAARGKVFHPDYSNTASYSKYADLYRKCLKLLEGFPPGL